MSQRRKPVDLKAAELRTRDGVTYLGIERLQEERSSSTPPGPIRSAQPMDPPDPRKRMRLTGSSVSMCCELELQEEDEVNWKLCLHVLKRMRLTGSSVSMCCELELQEEDEVNWKLCLHVLYTRPRGVACDFCTERKTCTASYCETHVKQHHTVPALQRHTLEEAPADLQPGGLCEAHHRALTVFCRTDQILICNLCALEKHKSHDVERKQGRRQDSAGDTPITFTHGAWPGGMACDLCTERKVRAVKFCQTCTASYCETHVRQHYTVPALQRHTLEEAPADLQPELCSQHHRALELFCNTDRTLICSVCSVQTHRGHDVVCYESGTQVRVSLFPILSWDLRL
ncbi:hypothetical protein JZ751_015440 [Albula glossodonta]|uniref:B box-type domain-containing protein n=1 Tax=Albula glossodonta TaxID=121402 RepID=A0A8T2MV87_9TELE|nr:hypothetical protein JZ751_015440 [Albula glossodonta]